MPQKFSFDRYLNIRSAYWPAWLNDGQTIAFLSDITGTPQVWSVGAAGGWPDQLTFFEEKVWALNAAPDGTRLICSRDIGGNEKYQLFLVSSDGSVVERVSRDLNAIHLIGPWSHNGKQIAFTSTERTGIHFDVYIQDLKNPDPELVHQAEGINRVLAWSPDGTKLIVINEISSARSDLSLLDLETGEINPISPGDEPALNPEAVWAANGQIYYLTNHGQEFITIAKMDSETGETRYILDDPRGDIHGLALSPAGSKLAYTVNIDGYAHLQIYDLETGEEREISGFPSGVIAEPTFSPDGKQLAASVQSPRENLNMWAVKLDEEISTPRKLTRSSLAGIPRETFIAPELIHYPTFDGRSVPGFFYKPQHADAPPACILYVHGGPASQTIPDFDTRFQFFLQQGYAILAPNVRGSSGYGKTYMAMDDVELRMDSVTDLKYAVDWLHNSGEVDPDRIAIYGRSYGGFMVLSAITTYPDLWAAAIDVVGIANWITFLENTGSWRRAHREQEYGSLKEDSAFLETISPIHHIDQIRCPLLVVHGANDPRVPVTEADQIVSGLQERGHPVEYLRYEDEGHKIAKLKNRIHSFTKMADFLARHL